MSDQPSQPQPCTHAWHTFLEIRPDAQGRVSADGKPIIHLEINKIMCKKCSMPLAFEGITPGFFPDRPGCGVDGTSITLPMTLGPKKFEVETVVVQKPEVSL